MSLTDQCLIKFVSATGTLESSGYFPTDVAAMQTSCASSAAIIAAATSGTTAQYMRGDGTLAAFPAIPTLPSLAAVATSGAYADLSGRPTIPSNTNQLTNGSSFVDASGSRSSLSLTTTGTGAASYNSTTGAFNIPTVTSTGGTVTQVSAGTGLSGGTFTTTGTISLPNTGTAGTYSGVTTDSQGRVTAGTVIAINDTPGRSIVTTATATGFQIDAARACEVSYDIDLSTTASIAGNASITVYLETALTNSTTSSDWTIVAKVSNSQALSLAITLQSVQGTTQTIHRKIAAGKWVRIRSVISGTATATISYAQEIKL